MKLIFFVYKMTYLITKCVRMHAVKYVTRAWALNFLVISKHKWLGQNKRKGKKMQFDIIGYERHDYPWHTRYDMSFCFHFVFLLCFQLSSSTIGQLYLLSFAKWAVMGIPTLDKSLAESRDQQQLKKFLAWNSLWGHSNITWHFLGDFPCVSLLFFESLIFKA